MRRLRSALGAKLAAVWVGGSAAMGAYEPGRSDLDVIAVASGRIGADGRSAVVAAVRHEALACPARKLELLVHRTGALARGEPGVELNLETGQAETVAPEAGSFWFVIDLSVARAYGRALAGPPPAQLVAEPDRRAVLEALAESIAWHARPGAPADDAVLNACRALLYAREGRWASKRAAGEWAVADGAAPHTLVTAALALRSGEPAAAPDPAASAALLDGAYRFVAARSASSRSGRRNS